MPQSDLTISMEDRVVSIASIPFPPTTITLLCWSFFSRLDVLVKVAEKSVGNMMGLGWRRMDDQMTGGRDGGEERGGEMTIEI